MRSFIIFVLLLCLAPMAMAASTTIIPSGDAFVSAAAANVSSNYGGAGALAVSSSSAAKGQLDSVMMFDLSGVKNLFDTTYGAGQWSVSSITLQLTAAAAGNAIFNANAAGTFEIDWMQNDSWTEGNGTPMSASATGGITWSTLPSFLGGSDQSMGSSFSYNGVSSGATVYTLSAGSGLIGDINSGSIASMHMFASSSTMSEVSNSRDFTTASSRPMLTITAVPEPASLGLAGLAALALGRRRRH